MAHISDMLVESVTAALVASMQDPYDSDDPTYAQVLREGLLQENPLSNGISVTVHTGDPDEVDQDAWVDELAEPGDPHYPNTPMVEIGRPGVTALHYWRRGTIKAQCFFIKTKENRDESRRIANVIQGRIERTLWSQSELFQGITDEFGETSLLLLGKKSYSREGGGPNQHIWRVYVWYQVLTFRS